MAGIKSTSCHLGFLATLESSNNFKMDDFTIDLDSEKANHFNELQENEKLYRNKNQQLSNDSQQVLARAQDIVVSVNLHRKKAEIINWQVQVQTLKSGSTLQGPQLIRC